MNPNPTQSPVGRVQSSVAFGHMVLDQGELLITPVGSPMPVPAEGFLSKEQVAAYIRQMQAQGIEVATPMPVVIDGEELWAARRAAPFLNPVSGFLGETFAHEVMEALRTQGQEMGLAAVAA